MHGYGLFKMYYLETFHAWNSYAYRTDERYILLILVCVSELAALFKWQHALW
jgi:hypothetical protein